jgi:hypothetical protein
MLADFCVRSGASEQYRPHPGIGNQNGTPERTTVEDSAALGFSPTNMPAVSAAPRTVTANSRAKFGEEAISE